MLKTSSAATVPSAPEDVKNLLGAAVGAANLAVFSDAQANPARRGMGTTLSALLLAGGRGFIAHVGDSRIYLSRGGEVRQLPEPLGDQ